MSLTTVATSLCIHAQKLSNPQLLIISKDKIRICRTDQWDGEIADGVNLPPQAFEQIRTDSIEKWDREMFIVRAEGGQVNVFCMSHDDIRSVAEKQNAPQHGQFETKDGTKFDAWYLESDPGSPMISGSQVEEFALARGVDVAVHSEYVIVKDVRITPNAQGFYYCRDVECLFENFDQSPIEDITHLPSEDPVIEDPVIEDPVIEDPVIEEPAAEDPVIEEPTAKEPAAKEPAAVESAAQEAESAKEERRRKLRAKVRGKKNQRNGKAYAEALKSLSTMTGEGEETIMKYLKKKNGQEALLKKLTSGVMPTEQGSQTSDSEEELPPPVPEVTSVVDTARDDAHEVSSEDEAPPPLRHQPVQPESTLFVPRCEQNSKRLKKRGRKKKRGRTVQ